MKKNKLILSSLILTGAISCSSFRPYVFTDALVYPITTTETFYYDLNYQYALFNQYASGLSYKFRMNYSNYVFLNVNFGLSLRIDGTTYIFQDWDFIGPTFAEAELDTVWTQRLNKILFGRQFNETTFKATTDNFIDFVKYTGDTVNFEIIIDSKITYNVNIGSVYQAFWSIKDPNIENFYNYLKFYNRNDDLLQSVLLTADTAGTQRNYIFNLSNIITNVSRFEILIQWVDTPPFHTGYAEFFIYEFNMFTQNSEIAIPDDASGDLFGFEFVAVEWWNILGHLQNFLWWIVNQSPLRPLFEWLDTYIISWIRNFIDILTGVFNL